MLMGSFRKLPERSRLQELFIYVAEAGELYWRHRHNSQIKLDKPAGWARQNGYYEIKIDNITYKRHRLVWCIFNGDPGDLEIDHINSKKGDDRIENLRLATRSQNQYNRPALSHNKSGYKGVSPLPGGKWKAQITMPGGRRAHLGTYSTPQAAAGAYAEAARKLHAEFLHYSLDTSKTKENK
jgi:hypothetical protein